MDKEKESIWLICFADKTCGSSCGTKKNAQEFAELRKDLYGGSYIIKEDTEWIES